MWENCRSRSPDPWARSGQITKLHLRHNYLYKLVHISSLGRNQCLVLPGQRKKDWKLICGKTAWWRETYWFYTEESFITRVKVVTWNHIWITANKRSSLSMENHVNSLPKVFAYQDKYILLGKIAWEVTSDWNDKKVTSFCWLIIHIHHRSSYWHA